jgi:hypothetical protein
MDSNLMGADIVDSDLRGSNLSRANLMNSDLRGAKLMNSNIMGADLRGSNIELPQFPSIRLLSSFILGDLSPELTLELMRRDAMAHPHPELFDKWANGGDCPYKDVERFWMFQVDREIWSPGLPQMTDRDLIVAICRERGWEIKGYLKIYKNKKIK